MAMGSFSATQGDRNYSEKIHQAHFSHRS